MKTPLGTDVDLGTGHMVLERDSAPARERGTAAPLSAHVYCGHHRPPQLLLSSCINMLEIRSVERGICLTAESIMTVIFQCACVKLPYFYLRSEI